MDGSSGPPPGENFRAAPPAGGPPSFRGHATAHATATIPTAATPEAHCGTLASRARTTPIAAAAPNTVPTKNPVACATMSVVEAAITSGLSVPDNPPVPNHPSKSAPATKGPHLLAH